MTAPSTHHNEHPLWYRVGDLRPRLVPHTELTEQHFRGETWYVMHNLVSGRAYRFTPRFHDFISALDGERTVRDVWESAVASDPHALTQHEVVDVLAQLYLADVLQTQGDALAMFERQRRRRQAQRIARAKNPLALRIPLFDPDRLLGQLAVVARPLFSPVGFLVWGVLVVLGVVSGFTHWDQLVAGQGPELLSPENLLLLAACYPVVKALHELGHGIATKVFGGPVHQAGFLLMAFIPIPYVDATASNTFAQTHRRVVVSAAGIMVELALASLALFVWLNAEAGLVKALAYNVMVIGTVSTLLVNGNPLLRFDAYYILADVLALPNLATRANRYVIYLVKRYGFGIEPAKSPASHASEPPWLLTYGVSAFVYKIVIMLTIAAFVAETYPLIGAALAIWALAGGLVWPVLKAVGWLLTSDELATTRGRAVGSVFGILAIVGCGLFVIPVPYATVAEGVVTPPPNAEVRAPRDGFFGIFASEPNTPVVESQPIIELADSSAAFEVLRLEGVVEELLAERDNFRATRRKAEEDAAEADLRLARAELAEALTDAEALTIEAPVSGTFVAALDYDPRGHFVRQGDLLGYVVSSTRPTVQVAIAQHDIALIRARTRSVAVRLVDSPTTSIGAVIAQHVHGAQSRLPSPILGGLGGGPITTNAEDKEGRETTEDFFGLEVRLPVPVERVGTRVYVRFDHGTAPVAMQWYRWMRQVFLARFSV